MKRFWILLLALVVLAGVSTSTQAEESTTAYVGAKIIPIVGDDIERGVLIVKGGKIVEVRATDDRKFADGTEVVDVSGKVLMPGIICTHSHIGGVGGGDGSGPLHPEVRIYDAINVRSSGFRRAVAGGLTTLNIMPGSGHLLSGQTVYVKLREARTIEDMFIMLKDGRIAGGMKMANGTNSQRDKPFPGTRGKSASLVREMFVAAQEYRDKIKKAGDDESKRPDRDLGKEFLIEVLEGRRVVHHHTHRNDDIMTVLRLAKEFGFRVVLHHVSEGWMVADEIAEAGVPCSILIIDSPGGKIEARNLIFETGAILEKAGVLTAFHTDDWITDSRLFLRMAALGVRAGMSRQKALEAMTISGAKILELDDRIGSLEANKDADFVVLDGDPLSVYTKVEQTYVEGVKVFDRSDPEDHLHAVGGFGAGDDQEPYLCCREHEDD
ncbi:MAG: amidohydrolase family protein [Phycisphaerales bacterium]|nr:amidohydrolase family protein [Phycisphaerales bacterium]